MRSPTPPLNFYEILYNVHRREVRSLFEIEHWTFEAPTSNKEMNTGLNYRHSEFSKRLIWRQNRSGFACTYLSYCHTIQK